MECCKLLPKMPSKTGVSRAEIAAHAFECSVDGKCYPDPLLARYACYEALREVFSRPRGDVRSKGAEEGLEAVRKVAKKSPEAFVAIAARICPNDVRLTLEQAIPGGMSLEDYSLMREVIAAIGEGLPDADQMQPGQVFQHVVGALRNCPNNNFSIHSSPSEDA